MSQPDLSTILTLVAGVIVVVVLFFLAVTDFFAFFAFSVLIGLITFILVYFKFVTFTLRKNELDIIYNMDPFEALQGVQPSSSVTTTAPAPAPTLNEVFYVSDNRFTYEEAQLVCKAYGSTLATYSQVEQAYNDGAEWCGYGWSDGGIALFPTQLATWEKTKTECDPQKRIKCGRPGINGGYFDPKTKFGVNCYGIRPAKPLTPPPPTDANPAMDKLLAQLKNNLNKFIVQPFNKKVWSEVEPTLIQSSQTSTPTASPVPGAPAPGTAPPPSSPSAPSPPAGPTYNPALLSSNSSLSTSTLLSAPPNTTATTTTRSTTKPPSVSTTTGTNPTGVLNGPNLHHW
jgi:hypothetical protein